MCGFYAVLGAFSADEASRLAKLGHALQGHRGPDGAHDTSFELANGMRVLLGHQRLSIIDLSDGGKQPMTSRSGLSTISYNGEIYNTPMLLFFANWLDGLGYIEHGSGIGCSWLTKKGREVLAVLQDEALLATWRDYGSADCYERGAPPAIGETVNDPDVGGAT